MQLYAKPKQELQSMSPGQMAYIATPRGRDPSKLRNYLSVTANRLWGPGAAKVSRMGKKISVVRMRNTGRA